MTSIRTVGMVLAMLASPAQAEWACSEDLTPEQCVQDYYERTAVRVQHDTGRVDQDGNKVWSTGTAFHVGGNQFVTSWHVLDTYYPGAGAATADYDLTERFNIEVLLADPRDDTALVILYDLDEEVPEFSEAKTHEKVYAGGYPSGGVLVITEGYWADDPVMAPSRSARVQSYPGMSGGALVVHRDGYLYIVGQVSTAALGGEVYLPVVGSPDPHSLKDLVEIWNEPW